MEQSTKYDDIINLPHPTSSTHPRMPVYDRAAQFAPFAALTGHDAAIRETARLTDRKVELDEDTKARLNKKLQIIAEQMETHPLIEVTYFLPDDKKEGGAYICVEEKVKKIDMYHRCIVLSDERVIPIDEIFDLNGEIFTEYNL